MAKANIRANTNAATGGRPAGVNNVIPEAPEPNWSDGRPGSAASEYWDTHPSERAAHLKQMGRSEMDENGFTRERGPRKAPTPRDAIQNARNPRNWQERPVGRAFEGARQAYGRDRDFKQANIKEAIERVLQIAPDEFRGGPSFWSPEEVWVGPGPEDYRYYDVSPEEHAKRAAADLRGGYDVIAPRLAPDGEIHSQPLGASDYDFMNGGPYSPDNAERAERLDSSFARASERMRKRLKEAEQRLHDGRPRQGEDYSGYNIPF